MNCKPPCMAIIIGGRDPRYIGRVVDVSCEFVIGEFGFHLWACSPAHEGLGCLFNRPNDTLIPDDWLRQINDPSVEEEIAEERELAGREG